MSPSKKADGKANNFNGSGDLRPGQWEGNIFTSMFGLKRSSSTDTAAAAPEPKITNSIFLMEKKWCDWWVRAQGVLIVNLKLTLDEKETRQTDRLLKKCFNKCSLRRLPGVDWRTHGQVGQLVVGAVGENTIQVSSSYVHPTNNQGGANLALIPAEKRTDVLNKRDGCGSTGWCTFFKVYQSIRICSSSHVMLVTVFILVLYILYALWKK